jgi:hypothetical protein
MDIRTAIAPQFNKEGSIELIATVTYDDLLDTLGELSAEFADIDFMVRLLKREQNNVDGLDILLYELGGSIKKVGDKLISLKTELPE